MVDFAKLWGQHPINQSDATPCLAPHDLKSLEGLQVPKGYPVFHNQCAIRMGVALREAGVPANLLRGVTTCGVHPPEAMHFINATDLANAISRANLPGFGPREVYAGPDAAAFYHKMFGRTGAVYFKDYWRRTGESKPTGDHIDVWNGYRSSAKWLMEWFSWLGYYSNYAHSGEIWFWEVK